MKAPRLVEVVARADHLTNRLCIGPFDACRFGEDHRVAARSALAALSSVGALMPDGGQTREEWGVHRASEEGDYTPRRCPALVCTKASEHGHRFRRTAWTSAWTETTA